jgi:ABC-type oligopeptide transport system ATPase subunit
MEKVEIAIIGNANSGKTTIAQEIVELLRDVGFEVEWDVKPDYETEKDVKKDVKKELIVLAERMKRVKALANKTIITVKERTLGTLKETK